MKGASGETLVFDGWHWQFEFKPQDLWVGAFWKRIGNAWDLWICFIPCVPLHISWWYHDSTLVAREKWLPLFQQCNKSGDFEPLFAALEVECLERLHPTPRTTAARRAGQ